MSVQKKQTGKERILFERRKGRWGKNLIRAPGDEMNDELYAQGSKD